MDAFYKAQSRYQSQGTAALEKERVRSKGDLCAASETGGTASIGLCLANEVKTTEQNYFEYLRAIGALLRLSPDGGATRKKIAFDAAESAWQAYREQGRRSVATQWEGKSQAQVAYPDCILKATWNHMNELANMDGDLWH